MTLREKVSKRFSEPFAFGGGFVVEEYRNGEVFRSHIMSCRDVADAYRTEAINRACEPVNVTLADFDRVCALAATIKLKMDVLQRRLQGKPGHQNITPMELIANARKDLDEIERELKGGE